MKRMWAIAEKTGWGIYGKRRLFLFLNTLIWVVIGTLIWLVLRLLITMDWTWGFCIIGYSAYFAGYIRGIFYLMNNNQEEY